MLPSIRRFHHGSCFFFFLTNVNPSCLATQRLAVINEVISLSDICCHKVPYGPLTFSVSSLNLF